MNDPALLFLVPTPVDGFERPPAETMSPVALAALASCRFFLAENARTAERLLSRILPPETMRSLSIAVIDEHSEARDSRAALEETLKAGRAAFVSEAGCPCVADPGATLVSLARELGIRVVPLPGPSSLMMALMVSGCDARRFEFRGYLPASSAERRREIRRVSAALLSDGVTRVFIETPYRSKALLEDLVAGLDGGLTLSVSIALGTSRESNSSGPVSVWRSRAFEMPKEPAVFVVGNPARLLAPLDGIDVTRARFRSDGSETCARPSKTRERPSASRPGRKRRFGPSGRT